MKQAHSTKNKTYLEFLYKELSRLRLKLLPINFQSMYQQLQFVKLHSENFFSAVASTRKSNLCCFCMSYRFIEYYFLKIRTYIYYQQQMLPSLKKINDRDFSATDTKVYQPPRELSHYEPKRDHPSHQSARNPAKSKVGGGFKLATSQQQSLKAETNKVYDIYNNYNSKSLIYQQKKSSSDLGSEIKLIERKIRQCQRKIEEEKKRKIQQQRKNQENRYEQDFDQIIKRELELHGYAQNEPKGFDYLTNPGGAPQQEEPTPGPPQPEPDTYNTYSISEGVEKLERFYENSLKKKFERRQAVHKACRRKTPKLFITHKTNTLNKVGKPQSQQEHRFRVMTKQVTPQQIYPVIPNFGVVKDNLSKNIVAYLGEYKPFIDKTKEKVQKQISKNANKEQIVIENSSKSIIVNG